MSSNGSRHGGLLDSRKISVDFLQDEVAKDVSELALELVDSIITANNFLDHTPEDIRASISALSNLALKAYSWKCFGVLKEIGEEAARELNNASFWRAKKHDNEALNGIIERIEETLIEWEL